jgi:HEAT repeat protein
MKKILKHSLVVALALGALSLATLPATAAPKTEDQLIADLSSPKDSVVTTAMQHLEKEYPTSTKAHPQIKKLLTDPREAVRRKAGRTLGALHAEVSEEDIKNICKQLKSANSSEAIDGLKSLRGLKAESAIPDIVDALKSPTPNVQRDACRTLAVLGSKKNVADIEPLLKSPNAAVEKDAQDAIFTLKAKP